MVSVTIEMSPDEYGRLARLAARSRVSVPDLIRRAIRTQRWQPPAGKPVVYSYPTGGLPPISNWGPDEG